MYLPKHFEGDEAIGREIMQAHSWALLTTTAEDGAPLTTHLSLLWQEAGGPSIELATLTPPDTTPLPRSTADLHASGQNV